MANGKTKLELTWIGKENRPKLEPRILREDPAKSYHAPFRTDGGDIFDNILIYGDNLLALKAIEQHYAGQIKCVYIDPPFNTGAAFEHYDDGVEHSTWLRLMRDRFEMIHRLLHKTGVLAIHLDDTEMAYAKIVLDEVFGRGNYLNTVTMTTNDPSGFKATGATIFSTANYLMLYAKEKAIQPLRKVFIEKHYDTAYSKILLNRGDPYAQWKWTGINDAAATEAGFASVTEAKRKMDEGEFESLVAEYAISHAESVFQTAAIGGGAAIKRRDTIEKSKRARDKVFVHPGEDVPEFYILNGRQILFYEKRLVEIDGRRIPGEVITDVWTDISWNGIASEGGVEFKNGKKPEALIRRILEMTTSEGDWVLDSFAGSGTTGAVAHKMRRRWMMVELAEQCDTHVVPRIKRVIDGEDQAGISKIINWKGGGGFRYYTLAPSLLEKDRFGNWVISKKYDAAMLAEAICKLEGFTYAPSDTLYWQHGQSTESSFIYVTTQTMTREMLAKLSDEVGAGRSLVVYCSAFRVKNVADFSNLTIKKIPKAVLTKCEWGKDDYSLEIKNLPLKPAEPDSDAPVAQPLRGAKKKQAEPSLFATVGANAKEGK
jgi:adenine-specific DNA-methyltransferase